LFTLLITPSISTAKLSVETTGNGTIAIHFANPVSCCPIFSKNVHAFATQKPSSKSAKATHQAAPNASESRQQRPQSSKTSSIGTTTKA
jgi:hypothetical protein